MAINDSIRSRFGGKSYNLTICAALDKRGALRSAGYLRKWRTISGMNSRTILKPAVPAYVSPALIATLSAPCQLEGDQAREIRLTPTMPVTPEIEIDRFPLLRRAVTG